MSTVASALKQTWPHEWKPGGSSCACAHCEAVVPFPIPQTPSPWHIITGQECAGRLRSALAATNPDEAIITMRLNGAPDEHGRIPYLGGNKIKFIKLCRGFIKGDNGLKAMKRLADGMQEGGVERVVIPEKVVPEFIQAAATSGVIVSVVSPMPTPSAKAERLLKALRNEPSLLTEMRLLLVVEPDP
ncbi:hypothetical protein N9917_00250 [Deltaproteobacteria bacterium]|nr:hypothetical protein [Deltaproteobacteria bacterium]